MTYKRYRSPPSTQEVAQIQQRGRGVKHALIEKEVNEGAEKHGPADPNHIRLMNLISREMLRCAAKPMRVYAPISSWRETHRHRQMRYHVTHLTTC